MHRKRPDRCSRLPLNRLAGAFPWLPPLEIGVGWAALMWDFAEDFEDLAGRHALQRGREIRVSEVKTKHGRLRIHYHGTPPGGPGGLAELKRLHTVIARAEMRASRTCERCGRPGSTALHAGWLSTLCLEHHAAEESRP
jgi:ribosomal protein S14